MEVGIPGVALFVEGMNVIGLGHVAKRFLKKYCLKLDEHNRKEPNNSAAVRTASLLSNGGEHGSGAANVSSSIAGIDDIEDEFIPPPQSPNNTDCRSSLRGGRGKKRVGAGGAGRAAAAKAKKKKGNKGAIPPRNCGSDSLASQGAKALVRTNEQQVGLFFIYVYHASIS